VSPRVRTEITESYREENERYFSSYEPDETAYTISLDQIKKYMKIQI